MAAPLEISDNHPLALELTSLRSAVARFQNEAHTSSIKLQHHALSVSQAHERTQSLERENIRLHEEIAVLRAHPHPSESSQDPTALQTTINQLTIALRSISDKLDLTEAALLARTTELAHAVGDLGRTKLEVEGAYELAARTRGREEEGLVRERQLQSRVRAAEEERKMSDLVVLEYADLVRSLEGRPGVHAHLQQSPRVQSYPASSGSGLPDGSDSTNASTTTLFDVLTEGKSGLQKLFSEFNTESTHLQSDIDRLTHDMAVSLVKYDAERNNAERDRIELAKAKFELEKMRMDDGTAAKMVSRYMKFSQQTANDLQSSLSTLTARHTSTLSTLSAAIQTIQASLSREKRTSEHLRAALDELSADIAREVYGRRREVALRLRLVARDERLGEGVRRLTRRIDDGLSRMGGEGEAKRSQVFETLAGEARELLDTLDGTSEETPSQGALGRIIAAESAVGMLTRELQAETEKRIRLQKMVADVNGKEHDEHVVPEALESGDMVVDATGNTNDGSPSRRDLNDVGDPLSPAANASNGVDVPVDCIDSSLMDSSTPVMLDPVNSVYEPAKGNLPSNERHCSVERAHPNKPPPGGLSSISPPLPAERESRPITPNANGQSSTLDMCPEGDLPPITAGSPDGPDPTHALRGIVVSAGTLHHSPSSLPQNLTVTVDTPTNSSPSYPLPVMVNSSDSVVSLPTLATESTLLPHPLLVELTHVCHRYDDLQRAFRDCHLALEEVKMNLKSSSLNLAAAATMTITAPVLQTVLDRLNDYTEDARVELEIRMADEALLARGFETLLSVPGALASAINPATPTNDDRQHLEWAEVERGIRAFIDGTDKGVDKALKSFTKKVDDIQHDIAAIKRAIYNPVLDNGALSASDDPLTPSTPLHSSSSSKWSSWTAGILGSSPRPVSPAPTFGNVMTTPRLRHSPSLNFYGRHGRKMSMESSGMGNDPFSGLGLRVPMPAHVHAPPVRPSVRPRALSAMYLLGLGAGSTGGLLSGVTAGFVGNGREETDGNEEAEEGDELDPGVE